MRNIFYILHEAEVIKENIVRPDHLIQDSHFSLHNYFVETHVLAAFLKIYFQQILNNDFGTRNYR